MRLPDGRQVCVSVGDRGVGVRVGGEEDLLRLGEDLPCLFEELRAGHLGHPVVGQHHRRPDPGQMSQRLHGQGVLVAKQDADAKERGHDIGHQEPQGRLSGGQQGDHRDGDNAVAQAGNGILHLAEGQPLRSFGFSDDDLKIVRGFGFLTLKPTMYIANVSEEGFENNPYLDIVRGIAANEGASVVPVCNKIEAEIAELDEEEREMFLDELGMEEPGLDRVIRAGYELLGLQTYFTAGVKEVRAWTVKIGATAPEGAGVIHTDFQKGFIRAEVVGFDDFIKYGGEQGAKDAGRWRLEGKDYVVQEGDVILFRFNV